MNIGELHWIAGLLEGEGYFGLKANKYPLISCGMTDKDVIDNLKLIIGKGNIYYRKPQELHHKPSWQYIFIGIEAMNLMLDLYPLMGNRRKEQINSVEDTYTRYQEKLSNDVNQKLLIKEEIKTKYQTGLYPYRKLAKEYKVSQVTISNWLHDRS